MEAAAAESKADDGGKVAVKCEGGFDSCVKPLKLHNDCVEVLDVVDDDLH